MTQPASSPSTSLLPGILQPLGWVAEPIYRSIIARRNRAFDAGVDVRRLPVPTISAGNLTVGGTGKTPTVMYIIRLLLAANRHPAIAMRGYRAEPGEMSDEQAEYAERLPGVPIAADPNRYDAVTKLLEAQPTIDCVVLDDGFQHRRLARNLDLVLIDAARPPWADHLLPRGLLREPAASLRRAHGVIVTHSEVLSETDARSFAQHVQRLHGAEPIAWTEHAWTGLELTEDGQERTEPVTYLAGQRVLAVCAIGRPGAFLSRIERCGATLVERVALRDHHAYSRKGIARILDRARRTSAAAIVTTAKDWVKIRKHITTATSPLPVIRPVLDIDVRRGKEALDQLVLDAVMAD
ncbi:MAG: tetraacyldisaccharide 4'-kinase [Phycisphaerales bacterium]|nr:tetraacyldisaccharide 4'-kinase [Phycisphaerales bacterium]